MKRILFILLASLFFSYTAKAEDYKPLLVPGKSWKIPYSNGNEAYTGIVDCYVKNDTVIDGKAYTIVKGDLHVESTGSIYPLVGMLLREEGGKVYVRLNKRDNVYYDFTLKVGDVTISQDNEYETVIEKVDAVDTICVDSVYRKRLTLNQYIQERYGGESRDYVSTTYWVEGIGSNWGIMYSRLRGGPKMIHCAQDGKVIFTADDFMAPPMGETGRHDSYHPLLKDGKHWYGREFSYVFSNEFSYDYYLSGDTLIGGETFLKCYRMSNRYAHEGEEPVFYAALQESDRRIYAVEHNGTEKKMIIDFNLEVGDSLHLAFDGELCSIVPEGGDFHYALEKIDTVTACDGSQLKRYWFKAAGGSQYEQWIEGVGTNSYPFVWNLWSSSYVYELKGCYEDGTLFYGASVPDGIDSNLRSVSKGHSPSFDLQGRPVARPAKGIYIQDGKKRVVK